MHDSQDPTTESPAVAAPVPVTPAQRAPLPVETDPATSPTGPVAATPAGRRSRRSVRMVVALTAIVACVVAAGAVVRLSSRTPAADSAHRAAAAPSTKAFPLSPAEAAQAALKQQANALLSGDEPGWLAAVDPGQPRLRSRYRTMYRSLRSLGVNRFRYQSYDRKANPTPTTLAFGVRVEYCFSLHSCPEHRTAESAGPATVLQDLKLKAVKGRYVITSMTTQPEDGRQPTPWQNDELHLVRGKRVTVAGPRSEAKHFARVLALAEKAAVVADRFAALIGNPQQHYRIYLAGPAQWRSWYGGYTDDATVGYMVGLGDSGTDVVLNMRGLRTDRALLASTIQHELGHVVTLGGTPRADGSEDMWIKEGIAEYIAWQPRPATASWRRPAVRAAVRGSRRPTSIAAWVLADNASHREHNTFYGLGHFAADCMASKYGQRALFAFVRVYVREDKDLDEASREAFRRPFAAVDKACVAWIRQHA